MAVNTESSRGLKLGKKALANEPPEIHSFSWWSVIRSTNQHDLPCAVQKSCGTAPFPKVCKVVLPSC
jgi:hypothetical protein